MYEVLAEKPDTLDEEDEISIRKVHISWRTSSHTTLCPDIMALLHMMTEVKLAREKYEERSGGVVPPVKAWLSRCITGGGFLSHCSHTVTIITMVRTALTIVSTCTDPMSLTWWMLLCPTLAHSGELLRPTPVSQSETSGTCHPHICKKRSIHKHLLQIQNIAKLTFGLGAECFVRLVATIVSDL